MIGLSYLAFFVLYLLIAALLTWFSAKAARRRGIAGWKWGLAALLAMLLLVFWDWIPTLALHHYYCATDGGYTRYKTLAQWDAENPGVAQTLKPSSTTKSIREGTRQRYVLNQRFAWDIHHAQHPLHIRERDERIVDMKTGEVLARYVDFDTDIQVAGLGPRDIRDLKFWLKYKSCETEDGRRTRRLKYEFNNFMYLVQHQREYKK
ncbi:MAG: hypothetical protein J5I92_01195 [Thiogranum sp.]|nr:hypothetical protein [Thiogranum sp.]